MTSTSIFTFWELNCFYFLQCLYSVLDIYCTFGLVEILWFIFQGCLYLVTCFLCKRNSVSKLGITRISGSVFFGYIPLFVTWFRALHCSKKSLSFSVIFVAVFFDRILFCDIFFQVVHFLWLLKEQICCHSIYYDNYKSVGCIKGTHLKTEEWGTWEYLGLWQRDT